MADSFWVNPQIREMKIAVLDDSMFSLKFIKGILSRNGYTSLTLFQNPVTALMNIFSTPPDLIIIDLILKDVTAIEVIDKLRQNKMTRQIPVLVISSSEDVDLIQKCLELGVDDFISKDKKSREILLRVNNALKREYFQKVLRHKQLQLENDIKLAAKMQFRLLPKVPFTFQSYRIDSLFKPYNIASGDFYQFQVIDKNHLLIMANDVSGHGVGTTFIVMYLDRLMRSYLSDHRMQTAEDLLNLVSKLNNHLEQEYGAMGLFTAAFVGLFDFEKMQLHYIQASFPPLIIRKESEITEIEGKSSPPLSVFPNYQFRLNTIPLDFDDLFIYSDGIYEIHDPVSGKMLDIEGLIENLSTLFKKGTLTPLNIYKRIEKKHQGNFEDDVTILMMKGMKNV